jgi:dual specificity phosphatase 12
VLLYVDEMSDLIKSKIEQGMRVLVHCVQGVSRSVSLVTGYLMKRDFLTFASAYSQVCERYPQANAADNFRQQLTDFAEVFGWNMHLNTAKHRLYRTRKRIPKTAQVDSKPPEACFRFLCRKCRHCLFLDVNSLDEEEGNIRVDCMEWMAPQVDEGTDGPLVCPNCSTKIGHFNWCGMLGDYGTPGFMVTASRVDKMPMSSGYKGDGFPNTRF